jgi:serine/threonine-protein kinase
VDVHVSTGPELTTVPDVVGKDRADARASIEDAGLKVTIHEEQSRQPKGRVIVQSPGPGATVARGARVTITVSKGEEKVSVPDVTDATQDDATHTLEAAGFNVDTQTQPTTDSSQDGKVIKQSPNGNTEATKGSTVTIFVGQFTDNNPSNTTGGKAPPGK